MGHLYIVTCKIKDGKERVRVRRHGSASTTAADRVPGVGAVQRGEVGPVRHVVGDAADVPGKSWTNPTLSDQIV